MTAQEALDIAREIVADGEYTTLTQTGTNAVATLADEVERLRAVINDAAGNLDGEHLASCDRWASVYARCNCVVGRAHALLARAVSL